MVEVTVGEIGFLPCVGEDAESVVHVVVAVNGRQLLEVSGSDDLHTTERLIVAPKEFELGIQFGEEVSREHGNFVNDQCVSVSNHVTASVHEPADIFGVEWRGVDSQSSP